MGRTSDESGNSATSLGKIDSLQAEKYLPALWSTYSRCICKVTSSTYARSSTTTVPTSWASSSSERYVIGFTTVDSTSTWTGGITTLSSQTIREYWIRLSGDTWWKMKMDESSWPPGITSWWSTSRKGHTIGSCWGSSRIVSKSWSVGIEDGLLISGWRPHRLKK